MHNIYSKVCTRNREGQAFCLACSNPDDDLCLRTPLKTPVAPTTAFRRCTYRSCSARLRLRRLKVPRSRLSAKQVKGIHGNDIACFYIEQVLLFNIPSSQPQVAVLILEESSKLSRRRPTLSCAGAVYRDAVLYPDVFFMLSRGAAAPRVGLVRIGAVGPRVGLG